MIHHTQYRNALEFPEGAIVHDNIKLVRPKTFVGTSHGEEIQNLWRNIMWPELFGHETVGVLAMRAEREGVVLSMVEWGGAWGHM